MLKTVVSECGGFEASTKTRARSGPGAPAADDYCAKETLAWAYDASKKTLSLKNNRVVLNCCGDHTISAAVEDGTYVITEQDKPKESGRCRCMCVYDFVLDIGKVPPGIVDVKLVRDVTDSSEGASPVYSGKIDLSKASGIEVVDETSAELWCKTRSGPTTAPAPE